MIENTSKIRNSFKAFRDSVTPLFRAADDPKYIRYFLVTITLIGAILRFYNINNPIGYDEAYTFINFSSKPFKFILADYHAPNNHILNSLLIGIAYRLLGPHNWIVRVPAMIASILGIPAAYLAGRRFFSNSQALAASAALAIIPAFVKEAANGRGYPLIILFSLLLANFAGILVRNQTRPALAAYALTGALGFYSIPIFLYPMAGVSLWVSVTLLTTDQPWKERWSSFSRFLLTCLASGALTLLLYSPVIIFGTGWQSIVANDIVKSEGWPIFLENLQTRSIVTWQSWVGYIPSWIVYLAVGSFLVSLLFYKKVSNQRLPMQIFIILGAVIMVVAQRVAPLERIWGYLEMFLIFYSAAGFTWILQTLGKWFVTEDRSHIILSVIILVYVLFVFSEVTVRKQSPQARANFTIAPEQFAAQYIAEHITKNDTIIAPSPVDLQTGYYLNILGVPYDHFLSRGAPVETSNALVVLRSRGDGKIKTMEQLLETFKLESSLKMDAAQVVFEYGPLRIYSIPVR